MADKKERIKEAKRQEAKIEGAQVTGHRLIKAYKCLVTCAL